MSTPLEIARSYIARNWSPVPVPFRQKRPVIVDWEHLRLTAESAAEHFSDRPANIGVILGNASNGLADVDLDCPEAVQLAPRILPATLNFGRSSNPRSHWEYIARGALTKQFKDGNGHVLVELRATAPKSGNGQQTVFPGSTHKDSGEAIEWTADCPSDPVAIEADELLRLVGFLAAACLVRRLHPELLERYLADTSIALPADVMAVLNGWNGEKKKPASVSVARPNACLADYHQARERFNADHPLSATSRGSSCPADGCEGKNSFKGDSRHATCFHSSHPKCGTFCNSGGTDCYVFDSLDVEAFNAGYSPTDFLEVEGYWKRPEREEPPPHGDADAPFDFGQAANDSVEVPAVQPAKQEANPAAQKVIVTPSQNEWPEPESLDTELLPVLPFNEDLIPNALRPWILDGANRAQTPLEFVAVPAMAALGSVIGRQIAVRPLKHDDWQEFSNIWGVLVGPPSEMKSHAMSTGLSPLDRLAMKAHEETASAMEEYEKALAVAKAKQKTIEKLIAKAVEAGDDTKDLQAQIQPLPEAPQPRRFKVTDSTPEKLADLLVHNQNGLLLAVDELAGWLHGLERDGHEQERSFYLTGWSGKSSYDVDRIGRGSKHIPAVCLSVIGTIQPGVWSNYVREALGSKAGADGFLQRFQMAVWPDPLKNTRVIDQYPNHTAKSRAAEIFALLSRIDGSRLGAEKSEFDKVPSLRFDEQAQPFAKKWLEMHRARWRSSTDHPALVAHMIKAQKTWASIALICHLVDWVTGEVEDGRGIGVHALEKAIGWVDYLESHARRIYGCGVTKDRSSVQVLAAKMRSGELQDGFTARDIERKHWAGLDDTEAVDNALRQFQVANWIRQERVKTKGRSRIAWRMHPRLLSLATRPSSSDTSDRSSTSGTLLSTSVTNSSDSIAHQGVQ